MLLQLLLLSVAASAADKESAAATVACDTTAFMVSAAAAGAPVHAAPSAGAPELGRLPPYRPDDQGWPDPQGVSVEGVSHINRADAKRPASPSDAWFLISFDGVREVAGKREPYTLNGWVQGQHLSVRPLVSGAAAGPDTAGAPIVMRFNDGRRIGEPRLWRVARLSDCKEHAVKLQWREVDLPPGMVKQLVIDPRIVEAGTQAPKRVWSAWVSRVCHFPDNFNCVDPVPAPSTTPAPAKAGKAAN
jgi:hypothetical protein